MASTTAKPISIRVNSAPNTLWGDTWRQYRKHKMAIIASVILIAIILLITVGPLFWQLDAQKIDMLAAYGQMSAEHPFGTDNLGRDTLARIMFGGRVSLAIGVSSMLIAMLVGSVVGLLSGYYKWLDEPLMRLTDLFL